MRHLIICLATIISLGDYWGATFSSHPDNVGVVVVTRCGGKEPISAYNWVDIDGDAMSAKVRKVWAPEGAKCRFEVNVMRQRPDGGPGDTYVGEAGVY